MLLDHPWINGVLIGFGHLPPSWVINLMLAELSSQSSSHSI